jgi:capsular polysaccharide export protein
VTAPRQFLFLQGLPGDFFARLGQVLAERGCGVLRVNFNAGDEWDWRAPGAINYRGSARAWPTYLARLILGRGITDIILFGDCRPLHRMARATAAGLGVAVHVFEEGYLRPDWVTLERGGVNGFSPLPSDPDWCLQAASDLSPIPDTPSLPSSLPRRVRSTVAYNAAAILLGWRFPRYHTHRPWPPLVEGIGWLSRLAGRRAAHRRSQAALARLRPGNYFVLPLQLDSDYQLRAHSDFDGMLPALAEIVGSFAAHADPGAQLVVKAHPLDNGLVDWRKQTNDYAHALGVSDRVIYLEVADIALLVGPSRGVVTVNSTTGALALEAGVPLITFGRAVYDMPGLTHQGPLATFWTAPNAPNAELYDAFRRVLADRCLLRGGFYAEEAGDVGMSLARAAADRILANASEAAREHRSRAHHSRTAPDAAHALMRAAE